MKNFIRFAFSIWASYPPKHSLGCVQMQYCSWSMILAISSRLFSNSQPRLVISHWAPWWFACQYLYIHVFGDNSNPTLAHCLFMIAVHTCHRVVVRSAGLSPSFLNIEADTNLPPYRRRHFKYTFLTENLWISRRISLKFVPTVRIDDFPALF